MTDIHDTGGAELDAAAGIVAVRAWDLHVGDLLTTGRTVTDLMRFNDPDDWDLHCGAPARVELAYDTGPGETFDADQIVRTIRPHLSGKPTAQPQSRS